MDLSELKLTAIKRVINLNRENDVQEILEHLERLSKMQSSKHEIDSFFERVSEKYDDVLKKLSK